MTEPKPAFVLIHSPLVGRFIWEPVAAVLRAWGYSALIPALRPDPTSTTPFFWAQHATYVCGAARGLQQPVVLVGHSGGGPLLPAIRQLGTRAAAYLFVDCNLPRHGYSRLDLMGDPAQVEAFRAAAIDGLWQPWSEDDLVEVIPDPEVRARFVGDLHPMPLAVYEEALPVFDGFPDAPCGYLHFSDIYDEAASEAYHGGLLYRRLEGTHFHLFNDPEAVATAMLDMVETMGLATT
jgi:hypothetical protein